MVGWMLFKWFDFKLVFIKNMVKLEMHGWIVG